MSDVVYRSEVRIERVKGPVRRAYLPTEQEPVIFGVHGAGAEHYKVPEVAVVEGVDKGEMLGLVSGVEADSEHPIAKAIVSGAGRRGKWR
jgi:hypothetical protein